MMQYSMAARAALRNALAGLVFVPALLLIERHGERWLTRQYCLRGSCLAAAYAGIVSEAIASQDDIALIGGIQKLNAIPDVVQASVLSPDGTIRAHPQAACLGQVVSDFSARRALLARRQSFFLQEKDGLMEFVHPLSASGERVGVLRLGMELRTLKSALTAWRGAVAFVGVALWAAFCALGWLTASMIAGRIGRIRDAVERRDAAACASESGKDSEELAALARAIDDSTGGLKRQLEQVGASACRAVDEKTAFLAGLARRMPGIALLADENHRVIYAASHLQAALGISQEYAAADGNDILCAHLLDVLKNLEIIDGWKRALREPGVETDVCPPGLAGRVRIIALEGPGHEHLGTVIFSAEHQKSDAPAFMPDIAHVVATV